MSIDPLVSIGIVKGALGALGVFEKNKQFTQQKALNDLKTNLTVSNIEKNEAIVLRKDISNNFRIQLNAMKALGEAQVNAVVRGVSGKSINELENEILSNEASALVESDRALQGTLDALASQEEQILLQQNLFNTQEPDTLSDLLNVGIDTATTTFLAGQQSGAKEPIKF